MVVFTCNACGQSIRKNRVEKHWQTECRNCEVLSCMDCGKDFYGEEYASHTSCISEAEKYQGALFKGEKGGGTKGEKKQQEWIQNLKHMMSSRDFPPRIANLLGKILDYPNIPRKKAKFQNFLKNSINVRDASTLDQLWDVFSEAASGGKKDNKDQPSQAINEKTSREESSAEDAFANGKEKSDEGTLATSVVAKKKKKKKKDMDDHEKVINGCNGELESEQGKEMISKTVKKKKKKKEKDVVDPEACERKRVREDDNKDEEHDIVFVKRKKPKVDSDSISEIKKSKKGKKHKSIEV